MNSISNKYKNSTFFHIRKILNSYILQKTFTRKEIIKKIKRLNPDILISNFDNHYRILKNMGYLKNVSKGKYQLLKLIPDEGINDIIRRNK